MQKNRVFTFEDVKNYAISRGYEITHQRYKRVFTLRNLDNSHIWSWVYLPHNPDSVVELVDDLDMDGWKDAIDKTIISINIS